MTPRFSVVVPTFNREKLVGSTIDSVLAQTLTDYELIVVDDGSTDATPEVLRSYGTRIKTVRQANQGPEVARDRGIALAAGEYVALLDSDDLLWPRALETYERIIQACGSPALILGATIHFQEHPVIPNDDGTSAIEVFLYRDYLAKDVEVGLNGSNMVMKKSVVERAGGLRQSTPTTFHMDLLDTILRLGVYGPCVVVRQPTTVSYRVHQTNSVRDVERMTDGIYPIVRAEWRGQYPGGTSRRFARFACIGGIAWYWLKRARVARRPRIVCKYLVYCAPMLLAGALKKMWGRARGTSRPVRVPRG
ncbi:MAG TPA: glycosyltransferase family A protein [Verrucomicrobiae bacterium]|nr:glycosyltransferase family A protein [Verrucomicrobiae bacterium]